MAEEWHEDRKEIVPMSRGRWDFANTSQSVGWWSKLLPPQQSFHVYETSILEEVTVHFILFFITHDTCIEVVEAQVEQEDTDEFCFEF